MKFDKLGFIEMEQSPFPGSIGDSCAETSRYIVLMFLIGRAVQINLRPFVTNTGVVRYPSPPSPWGENDTSDDQVSPLLAAAAIVNPHLCWSIAGDLQDAGFRTGNGQFMHLSSYAQLCRALDYGGLWLLDFFIFAQALIFKLPYRWDDSTHRLAKSHGSTSDYLNFINYLAFAKWKGNFTFFCRLAISITPKEKLLLGVSAYYSPEPNNQMILEVYRTAIEKIYEG